MPEDCKQEIYSDPELCNEIKEHVKKFGWQPFVLDCHPADITPKLINSCSESESIPKGDVKFPC